MGDPADVAFAAVASQRLGNLGIAKPGVIDPNNIPAAAQGLFQQAVICSRRSSPPARR
jgi:hypothetical protein